MSYFETLNLNYPGSIGTDLSVNKPTLPNVGAAFGGTGVFANYVLLQTVAANTSRISVDIRNVSNNRIVLIMDDGTAANGAAPNNATIFPLEAGSDNGVQGNGTLITTEKGRIQIYALSNTSYVSIRQN